MARIRHRSRRLLCRPFDAEHPRYAYLFANRRTNRMKVLLHGGFGIWLAARRLNQDKIHWPGIRYGSAISRALDRSLKCSAALSRYLDDGAAPIDDNWAENQIRPRALGRKTWLFESSLRSGKRAVAKMS